MKKIMIAFSVVILAGCSHNRPVELTATTNASSPKAEVVKLEKGNVGSSIKLPGELKPYEKVDIYPKVNGFVKEVLVDRGTSVREGQVLLTLEAPEIEQQLQSAQAKMLQSTEMLNGSKDRYYRLLNAAKTPGAVSDIDLMNAASKFMADSAMQQAEVANVNSIKAIKDYLVVKAPFDGVITERNIHPGSLTGPNFKMDNKPLLVLQNNKKLRLEVFIPEEYSTKVDMSNKQLSFSTDALPGKVFKADISRSSNSLYDDFRSEALEADVMNTNDVFKPGMYVEVRLNVKADVSSYMVPATAIVTSTEGKYVVAIANNTTRLINVKEGITNNGLTEVFGDFTGDESVLKQPGSEIKGGVALK